MVGCPSFCALGSQASEHVSSSETCAVLVLVARGKTDSRFNARNRLEEWGGGGGGGGGLSQGRIRQQVGSEPDKSHCVSKDVL